MKQDKLSSGRPSAMTENKNRAAMALLFLLFIGIQVLGNRQMYKPPYMTTVRVRYMVNDLQPAIAFYTTHLGFQVRQQAGANFALLSLGGVDLVLSTPFGPGGAAKPMHDGSKAAPGGWNRLIINVDNLKAEVARLRAAQAHFRNDIATGPGGAEILLDDPSGNPIELFQPAAATISDDEAAIRAMEDRFVAAFNAGDIDAMMKNYISDKSLVVFDLVPPRQHNGPGEYCRAWQGFFTHFKGKPAIAITQLSITVNGNTGFGHSIQHVTGTDVQGHPVDRTVRVTDGYKKVGGNWLIAMEHISVPIDLATGKPDFTSKP